MFFRLIQKQPYLAIQKDLQRDFMDRVGRGEVDFSGGITAAQDAARMELKASDTGFGIDGTISPTQGSKMIKHTAFTDH